MGTILDSDDEEAKQCKQEHNTALAMNTKMHIIDDNLEHLSEIDKGKIKEMEKNYNPKSEEIFKETWDLSVTCEDDSIVKNLSENLKKLNLETKQENYLQKKKNVKSYPNPMLLFLPFQGKRSLVLSIPLEWRAKMSSILQRVQNKRKHPLKTRQENTNMGHK